MNNNTFMGSTINRIKLHNMQAVLLSLLYHEPAYRVKLAEDTGLSTTTITNLVDELAALDIVREGDVEQVKGRRRVGRPRAPLRLNANARYAIGVHLGTGTYRIAIANLRAEIHYRFSASFHKDEPAMDVLHSIGEQIKVAIAECGLERDRIIGVGVGTAGLVNYLTGKNIVSANLGWRDVPIRDWLSEQLGLPVVVENNVKAMALGEAFFGQGRGVSSLVFVYGRTGVGAGIVVGNRIFQGSSLGAGEIGHTIMVPDDGQACRCGKRGCLETLVSEPVLVERAVALAEAHPDSLLANQLQQDDDQTPLEHIFAAAREGDSHAQTAIDQCVRYLGVALANLVNVLNPELIILGGMFAQGQDVILPQVKNTVEQSAFAGLGQKVRLEATEFGRDAGVIGAAALALTTFFYLSSEEI